MGLYDRLLGHDDLGVPVSGKIPVHQFQALMAEFGRGNITGQQAQDAIAELSGSTLTPSEVTEAQTLLNSITGSVTNKLVRVKVIDDVLLLAESPASLYGTPTKVKTRLGV